MSTINVRLAKRLRPHHPALLGATALISTVVYVQAETQVMHTKMNDTTSVQNITTRAWDDVRLTSGKPPTDVYTICGWGLGNISKTLCYWDVGSYTAWRPLSENPTAPYQVAVNGNDNPKSAMQAAQFGWGGYMRHYETTSPPNQMTIRYSYGWQNQPCPWSYSPNAKLVFEFEVAIPHYDDRLRPEGDRAIGWGVACILLKDKSIKKPLNYTLTYFDKRAADPSFQKEKTVQVGSGEMCVRSFFLDNTRFCTRRPGSSYERYSTWPSLAYFGISISRNQLIQAVQEMNAYIAAHPELSRPFYSTNPDDYALTGVNVGIEAALDFDLPGGGTTGKLPMTMGYKGARMKASTVY